MKKLVPIILSLAMLFSLCSCGSSEPKADEKPQTAEFNSTITVDSFEITTNSDIITGKDLNGDTDQYEEFLTTDMTNYGDTVVCDVTLCANDGYTYAVVTYFLKNIGKDKSVFDKPISLNYDDGYTYDVKEQYYYEGRPGDLHEFVSLEMSPLTTVECRALFVVPEEVFSNTDASLKLTIGNIEYTIR